MTVLVIAFFELAITTFSSIIIGHSSNYQDEDLCYKGLFWIPRNDKTHKFKWLIFMHIIAVVLPVGQLMTVFYCVPRHFNYFNSVDLNDLVELT